MAQPPTPLRRASSSGGRLLAPLLLLGFFCLLWLPVLLSGAEGTPEAYDGRMYHRPVIEAFARDLPRPNLASYESATAPAYHLLMAVVWRATASSGAMHAVNAAFGLGLVAALYVALRRPAGPWGAAALALPVACSPYTVGGTIWLTTDNAAMLCIVLALGGAVIGGYSPGKNLRLGLYAALATGVRQIHVWLAAPVGIVGLLATCLPGPIMALVPRWIRDDPWLDRGCDGSPRNLVAGVIAAAMPVAMLGFLVWQWGGQLTPATMSSDITKHAAGANLASPAFALALVAALGIFFVPVMWEQVRRIRFGDIGVLATAGAGLIVALMFPTSHLIYVRDFGWLWKIIEKLPSVAERSLVVTALAPLGALVLLMLYRGCVASGRRIPALILLLSLLGWLMAQTMNSMAWQRYFEPMILVGLSMLAALTRTARERVSPQSPMPEPEREGLLASMRPFAGSVALACFYIALNAITMYREVLRDLAQ
jgi:hypothetical protein